MWLGLDYAEGEGLGDERKIKQQGFAIVIAIVLVGVVAVIVWAILYRRGAQVIKGTVTRVEIIPSQPYSPWLPYPLGAPKQEILNINLDDERNIQTIVGSKGTDQDDPNTSYFHVGDRVICRVADSNILEISKEDEIKDTIDKYPRLGKIYPTALL